MNKKLKILVIEDKEMHRKSAAETLTCHEVTIVESFDKAMDLMKQRIDEGNVQRLLVEAGFFGVPDDENLRKAYWETREKAEAESVIPFPFEAVLTDMMMPMSNRTLADEVFDPSEQVPYGFIIALTAAHRGAKFVAMLTDTNHHNSAMSAALDHFGPSYYEWEHASKYESDKPKVFNINGAKVVFVHTPFVQDFLRDRPCDWCKADPGKCRFCNGTGVRTDLNKDGKPCNSCTEGIPGVCERCRGTLKYDQEVRKRKDWGKVLADLIA